MKTKSSLKTSSHHTHSSNSTPRQCRERRVVVRPRHFSPLLQVGSFPKDAILQKLIPCGLPTSSSSSGTAPYGAVPRGPPLQHRDLLCHRTHGLQRDSLLHQGLQVNLCSNTWSTSCPLLWHLQGWFSHTFSPLFPRCCCTAVSSPFNLFSEAPPAPPMVSALVSSRCFSKPALL